MSFTGIFIIDIHKNYLANGRKRLYLPILYGITLSSWMIQ